MNSYIIIWSILALISQLLHYWKYYKNESPSYLNYLKWFVVWFHQKVLDLSKEVIHLLIKSKLMFEISTKIIIDISFVYFCLSLIWFRINSSFSLYSIHIFWSVLFSTFGYFTTNITFSQMTYSYVICLYLKLKLRNVNNSITKTLRKSTKCQIIERTIFWFHWIL
jgi:hypothetical protein